MNTEYMNVGDTIDYEGTIYQCEEGNGCLDCAFHCSSDYCMILDEGGTIPCICPTSIFGSCKASSRNDGRNVVFKEVVDEDV